MATERMYELAFAYRGAKLWQQVYDNELFAVRLSDGAIGYCSVMGELGEHVALGVYIGDSGYQSYRLLMTAGGGPMDDIARGVILTSQDCLQCSFEYRDMLSDEELAEVRQYAKAHEKTLRGKNAFPLFTKYRPGRYPWGFDSELDEQRICEALSAAIELKKLLRRYAKEDIGLYPLSDQSTRVPMLAVEGGKWIVKFTRLPDAAIRYPEPSFTNEVQTARIKRLRKSGVWECGTMRLPNAIQQEGHEKEAPYFPLALVCLNLESGQVLQPVVTIGNDAEEAMNGFVEELVKTKAAPKTLRAADDRCFAILRDLCAKTGIGLTREEPEALSEVMQDLLSNMGMDEDGEPNLEQLELLCENLMQMRDGELKQMSEEMVNMLLDMADWGVVPKALADRIRKLFRRG